MRILLLIALFTFISKPLSASDFHSPRTAALGGAGHAGPLLTDAIYLNPSFVSLLPTYSLSFAYLKFKGAAHSDGSDYYGRSYNATIQDGKTELFQAGVGYTVREDGAMLHVGASKSFVERTGFGLGGKYIMSNTKRPTITDINLSFTGIPLDWLQLALIIDNLLQSETGKAHGFYREIVIGSKINVMGLVLLYFDPRWTHALPNSEKLGFEAGLELPTFADLFIRAGTFRNTMQPFQGKYANGWGLGLGWIGPRISLDYGMSKVVQSKAKLPQALAHTASVTVYF